MEFAQIMPGAQTGWRFDLHWIAGEPTLLLIDGSGRVRNTTPITEEDAREILADMPAGGYPISQVYAA